jgi:glycosyltransferase involved in cell wall biosynthesis
VTSATSEAGYGNYPEYLKALEEARIPVHLLDSLFKRDLACNLSVVEGLSRRLTLDDVDVIHAHAATPALVGLLLAARMPRPTPVVQTMHGWGIQKSPAQAASDIAVMRALDAVVTTSEASKRHLVSMGVPRERIHVIPCGLAPDPPARVADEVSTALMQAREGGAQVILCIGSVTANKNQKLLVESLPAVLRHRPVFCAFIGEGAAIGELSGLARDLQLSSAVRFFGHRPDAASYLSDADVLVLPSRSEGQGLAVLEAFRAGVIVVASDAPALEELVSGPEFGVTFASESREGLAAAIERATGMPAAERASIVSRARERFAPRFTVGVMNQAHGALYRSAIEDRLRHADRAHRRRLGG